MNTRSYLNTIFLLGTFFSILFAATMIFDYDAIQMMNKGSDLFHKHELVPIGNAASAGMGHLPGFLSSIVVGAPLFLWNSPYASLGFLIFLHVLSFFMLKSSVRDSLTEKGLILFFVLYWLSPWRAGEIFLWNPSYLFFATALHWWSALEMRKGKSVLFTTLHLFSLYFAFQLHNSSLILFIGSFFLFLRGMIKVHWRSFLVFAVLGLVSFIPYIQFTMGHPEFSQKIRDPDAFLGKGFLYVLPMLKGVSYWARFTSTLFPRHLFKGVHFEWISSSLGKDVMFYLWVVLKNVFAYGTLLFSLFVNFKFFKKYLKTLRPIRVEKETSSSEFNDSYAIVLFIAAVVSIGLSPIVLIHWHLLVVLPVAIYTFVRGLQHINLKLPPFVKKSAIPCLSLYLIYYCFIGSFGSQKHSISADPHREYKKGYEIDKKLKN